MPNGVDLTKFDPARYDIPPGTGMQVIFTGAMDYAPNVEAVCWFAANVWPSIAARNPHARFKIAGGPEQSDVRRLESITGIDVLGYVDDMAATIAGADIVVAPLLTARGIQNKVLEGMAMAKPVVATSAAHEGIAAKAGAQLLVADGANAFAEAVLTLLNDATKREAMGLAARQFIETHHSWQQSHHVLAELLGPLLKPEGRIDELRVTENADVQ